MMTVWKYPVRIDNGDQELQVPRKVEWLTAQMQHGQICLWALVDPKAPMATRRVRVVGTGHPTVPDEGASYIGTVQVSPLVFHVFDTTEVPR